MNFYLAVCGVLVAAMFLFTVKTRTSKQIQAMSDGELWTAIFFIPLGLTALLWALRTLIFGP